MSLHRRLDKIEADAARSHAAYVVPVRVDVGEDADAALRSAQADAAPGTRFVGIIRVNEAPPPDSQQSDPQVP